MSSCKKRQVRGFHEVDEMVVFERHPLGVNLPEHVLRGHFVNAAASERGSAVGPADGLERMAKFVGNYSVGLPVNAHGRSPQGADLIIDAATERGTAVAADHENQELVFRGERFLLVDPLERVDVVIVEAFALLDRGVGIETPVLHRVGLRIVAVFLGPEEHQVVGRFAALVAEFAIGIVEIVVAGNSRNGRGKKNFLACVFGSRLRGPVGLSGYNLGQPQQNEKCRRGFSERWFSHVDIVSGWGSRSLIEQGAQFNCFCQEELKVMGVIDWLKTFTGVKWIPAEEFGSRHETFAGGLQGEDAQTALAAADNQVVALGGDDFARGVTGNVDRQCSFRVEELCDLPR